MAKRTQQDEVYTAQEVLPLGRTFTAISDVQRFVDDLRELHWWPEVILRVEVQAIAPDWRGLARWEEDKGAGVIGLSKDGLNIRTVAHELAHVIADQRGSQGHDPTYCRAFLEVVYHLMGSDAYTLLRGSFELHGVVHDPREDHVV